MTEPAHPQPRFTVETAKVLAEVAHNRQKDKLKRPYREHVLAVGDALADFDDDIRIAGYLHDIAEDTPMTRQALLDMGVSERAADIIERVTKRLHENPDDYQAGIRYIAEDHDATLVKIADNAHNSLPERVKALAEKWPDKPPVTRYDEARPVLYAAVPVEETRKILARINPWLLEELDDMLDEADDTDYENLSYDDAGETAEPGMARRPAGGAEPGRRQRMPSHRARSQDRGHSHARGGIEPHGGPARGSYPASPGRRWWRRTPRRRAWRRASSCGGFSPSSGPNSGASVLAVSKTNGHLEGVDRAEARCGPGELVHVRAARSRAASAWASARRIAGIRIHQSVWTAASRSPGPALRVPGPVGGERRLGPARP